MSHPDLGGEEEPALLIVPVRNKTHNYPDCTRVNATLTFGRGDPLHAVDARLPAQVAERAAASHFDEGLLVRAGDPPGRAAGADALDGDGLDDLSFPALSVCDALVHPDEFGREEGGLVAADAGLELDEGREGLDGRGGGDGLEEVVPQGAEGEFGGGQVRLGEFAQVFVRLRVGEFSQRRDELTLASNVRTGLWSPVRGSSGSRARLTS